MQMGTKKNTVQIGLRPVSHSKKLAAAKNTGKLGKAPELRDTRADNEMKIDYFRFFESLYRKELNDWLEARATMRSPFNQLTFPIQQLYKDAMLDNHLQGAIESRILRVINKEFILKDASGKVDRMKSAAIQTRWFRHLVRKAMESKFYGYSVVFVNNLSQPNRSILDINRENVIPQKMRLINNIFDPHSEFIDINEFPNFIIYIQLNSDHYGALERIAPLTVIKRHSWAAWDEFEQIFGMPIRIARTMIQTEKHRDDLQKWLETMGTASYGIFDKQTDIEIKENSRTDAYKVYYEKIAAVNKEISKGIVGQTMTMDDGSSQSQANVHMDVFNDITTADIMDVQDWATDDLFPVLRAHGVDIPEGYYLALEERGGLKPAEKIKIDQILMQGGFNLDPTYVQDFYGTILDKAEPKKPTEPVPAKLGVDPDGGLSSFFV